MQPGHSCKSNHVEFGTVSPPFAEPLHHHLSCHNTKTACSQQCQFHTCGGAGQGVAVLSGFPECYITMLDTGTVTGGCYSARSTWLLTESLFGFVFVFNFPVLVLRCCFTTRVLCCKPKSSSWYNFRGEKMPQWHHWKWFFFLLIIEWHTFGMREGAIRRRWVRKLKVEMHPFVLF